MICSTNPTIPVNCARLYWDLLMGSVKDNVRRNLSYLLGLKRGNNAACARALGVDPGTVTRWAQGKLAPDVGQAEAIAQLFGVSTEMFLLGDVEANERDKPSEVRREPDAWDLLREAATRRGLKLGRDS